MEKQIPTTEITIEDEKVLVYMWLSQEEEDKLQSIMIGDLEVDPKQAQKGDFKLMLSADKLFVANKLMVQFLCKSHTWEVVNCWKPSKRKLLLEELNNIREKN